MCEECIEIDEKIARYRRLTAPPFDALTVERINALIADMEKQKRVLHPEAPPAD